MAETHHKAVLITGAGKRIGRALAEALAADGWAIAAHYAGSKSEAEALIAEITDMGGKTVALQADLRDAAAVQTLVADAAAALGPLTALINNASTFERDTAHTLTAESWDTHLNANLRA
ncbi:MAG: SDR family NAD(P)-dependent oxidoreductase, partial [PS1 clade bacterium]|nr:SDR family NAD(P)-dependent oxidoreductase [PS1 clade bacterium]